MIENVSRVPSGFRDFADFVRAHDYPVLIWGADIAGKVVAEILKRNALPVAAFVDNNRNKCGTDLRGIPVWHASELDRQTRDSVILVASTYIMDIIAQAEDMGFMNWAPIYQILADNREQHPELLLDGDLRFNHAGGRFTHDFDGFVLANMLNSQRKYLDSDWFYIRSVDLIVTEKCSLKCRDCSNLMQYYENPVNIELPELWSDLDDLCAVADEINEIRVIGGDPFMNKDCHAVVKKATTYRQINKVVVYTNGTICPSEDKIAAMADEKTFVFITTYGDLSRNVERLRGLLEKHNVRYNCQPAYGWTDCSSIGPHARSEENLRQVFKFCCAKHFTTVTGGKVFRCPFAANVERLRAMPDLGDNFVSVRGAAAGLLEIGETRRRLRSYLRDISYVPACEYCNGRTYGDPEIQPGIQTKAPLQYVRIEQ